MKLYGLLFTGALALASAAQPANAQSTPAFPSKSILIVVPTAAGGPLDLMARLLQPRMSQLLGQPVVVDNKPGAATYIAMEYVAKSPPDGHTVMTQGLGGVHTHLFVKGQMVMSKELTPVAMIGEAPNLILVSATIPPKTLREFVDYAKANPGKLNLAAFPNTALYLETLTMMRQIGVQLTEVPYNSSATIYQAMARGDVHFFMATVGGATVPIQAGHIRGLAIAWPQRSPQLPDVPTARELGFNGIDGSQTFAMLAPAKTPPAVLRLLNEQVTVALNTSDARERLEKLGYVVEPSNPDALATRLANMARDMERAAKESKIVPQ
jgi:tripartite-type tricarboxylate transporter receptor subunit TctC